MKNILILFVCLHTNFVFSQFEHCLIKEEGAVSPKASLSDISWIEGNWKGEAFGGICEEIWSAPLGGSMMGMFKLVSNNEVGFYEIMTIVEENETLIMRLKHFHGNLKGWEEKDDTVDFELVKVTENAVYFNGLSFFKRKDGINVYVIVGGKDGNKSEVGFVYSEEN